MDFSVEISSNRQKQGFPKWSILTTKVAHNGQGHFPVKKPVESRSLVEWRTDVHCSVHVVRLAVDPRSLSICYHEPTFRLDPQKALINGPSLVQGGDLGAMAELSAI